MEWNGMEWKQMERRTMDLIWKEPTTSRLRRRQVQGHTGDGNPTLMLRRALIAPDTHWRNGKHFRRSAPAGRPRRQRRRSAGRPSAANSFPG